MVLHGAVLVAATGVLAAGCGRFAFDARDGAGDGRRIDAREGDCWAAWHDGTIGLGTPRRLTELGFGGVTADPWLSPDGRALYVSHDDGSGGGYDLYVAQRSALGEMWSAATRDPDLSSASDEHRVSLSGDRLTAVISSNRIGGQGQDLWSTVRTAPTDPFPTPSQALVAGLNTAAAEYDPELTADGLRLYYAPQTTLDLQHIEYADRASTADAFGAPNQIPELVVRGINADPSLSPDQTVIVFAIQDKPAPPEIHYATREDATATFGAAAPVPGVLVGGERNSDPAISPDGCELYFNSDRDGPSDVYVATVP